MVLSRVPNLREKAGLTEASIVAIAKQLDSAAAADLFFTLPDAKVVELLALTNRAELMVMLKAELARDIAALLPLTTKGAIDNLLSKVPRAVDFKKLLACGSQPVAILLQCLPDRYLADWCTKHLDDTVVLLGHGQWSAVSQAIAVLANKKVGPSDITAVLNAPTDGADFAAIVNACETSPDFVGFRTISQAVTALQATPNSTLASYRSSLASTAAEDAQAKPPNPAALQVMITENLATITYITWFQTLRERNDGGSTYEFEVKTRITPLSPWKSWAVHIHQEKGKSRDNPAAIHFKDWDTRAHSKTRKTMGSEHSKLFLATYGT